MRLGAFVIHGNNAGTLGRCLDDLRALADDVVAVDSGSTDGSAELVRQRGIRRVHLPWQGFGAARAAAVEALEGCDWVFFLDSDEVLGPGAAALIRRAIEEKGATAFRAELRDWAGTGASRFLYRSHHRVRLVRRTAADWAPHMVVHESLRLLGRRSGIIIEHDFAPDPTVRLTKNDVYAWVWAAKAHAEGRRAKPPGVQRVAHFLKDAVVKGAAFRGGLTGVRLAWALSEYHSRKYEYLGALRAGDAQRLAQFHRCADFAGLFQEARRLVGAP